MSDLLRVVERSQATTRWTSRTSWRASMSAGEGADPDRAAPPPALDRSARSRSATPPRRCGRRRSRIPSCAGSATGRWTRRAFQFYIRQDYLFLIDYGRLLSLGAARAPRLAWMRRFAGAVARRCWRPRWTLHREFAARWGVDRPGGDGAGAGDRRLLRLPAAHGRRWATSASWPRPCALHVGLRGDRHGLARSATSDALRASGSTCTRATSSASSPTWARELLDEVDGDEALMTAAFVASSRHELAFWEAAWQHRGRLNASTPGERWLGSPRRRRRVLGLHVPLAGGSNGGPTSPTRPERSLVRA